MSQISDEENLSKEFSGPNDLSGLDRRDFLKYMGLFSSMSLLAHCSKPADKIVPFSRETEEFSKRSFEYYSSAFNHQGFAQGITIKSYQGRPIKIEGNAKHPFSLGATTPAAQATLYELYHPDRLQQVLYQNKKINFDDFHQRFEKIISDWNLGEGVAILFPPDHSPTTNQLIKDIQKKYPKSAWASIAPWKQETWINHDVSAAQLVISFDEDIFFQRPDALKISREFMEKRKKAIETQSTSQMNELFVFESSPTLAGGKADKTIVLSPDEIFNHACDLRDLLKGQSVSNPVIQDLSKKIRNSSPSLVFINPSIHPEAQALEIEINGLLNNSSIMYEFNLPETHTEQQILSLAKNKKIHTLIMIESDPLYWNQEWQQVWKSIPQKISLSTFHNESSVSSEIQIAKSHFLETWSDLESPQKDVSIQQPLIKPIFASISTLDFLSGLLNKKASYEIIYEKYKTNWKDSLITGMALTSKTTSIKRSSDAKKIKVNSSWKIKIIPDPSIHYGQYADNPVMQELPKNFSKLTWQNAFLISKEEAQEFSLKNGDVIKVTAQNQEVEGPVWITQNIAPKTLVATLGYGHKFGSYIRKKRGFNASVFKNLEPINFKKTWKSKTLASTQGFQKLDTHHPPVKEEKFSNIKLTSPKKILPSLYPQHPEPQKDVGPQWGMTIDLTTCTGCQACVSSCQVENNIPFVGEEQVQKDRILHWIRIDTYHVDERTFFQPVPCMHCEKAPCEVVCPVNATVHGKGGLNEMVYNRCVGTRYCSNNCPYKVRRFNFGSYSEIKSPWNMGFNPEVSVRDRGVMEKCTYCIQLIKEGEHEGVAPKTACQKVCPTNAIEFGDIRNPESQVAKNKKTNLNYDLLEEEGAIPRTSYLKVIRHE